MNHPPIPAMRRVAVSVLALLVILVLPAGAGAQGPLSGERCAVTADTVLSYMDFTAERIRPLQRVVFEDLTGGTNSAVPAGTIIRFYTDALGGPLTFSLPDAPAPTYAFVEVQRPGGTPACGGGGNQQGCAEVSGVWVYAPVTTYHYELPPAVNGGANSTNEFHLTSDGGAGPEESLAIYTNSFEIRFDGVSWAVNPFSGFPGFLMGFEVPFTLWDIGPMNPGDPNDPSDDVRLIPGIYSDIALVDDDMCANNATSFPYRFEREIGAGLQTDRIYAYWPSATYDDFAAAVAGFVVAAEPGPLPTGYALLGARPNPSTGSADIQFVTAAAGPVLLEVMDVLGRTVATLVDDSRPAGTHSARADVSGLPAGAYLLRLRAGGGIATRPMSVTR